MTRIQIEIAGPTEAEDDFRRGKRACVVPLSETDAVRLGTDAIVVHEGLAAMADSLAAFVEGRELYGVPDPELKAELDDIAIPPRPASDPKLEAFIRARIGHMTIAQIITAVAATFPPNRRTSMSGLSRWGKSNRQLSADHTRSRFFRPSPPSDGIFRLQTF